MSPCYLQLSRPLLAFFGLLCLGAAGVMAFGGAFLILTYKNYKYFFQDYYLLVPGWLAVLVAFLLILTGVLGICIPINESRYQQGVFLFFTVVLLCLEVSSAVISYLSTNRIEYELSPMEKVFGQYNGSDSDRSRSVDLVQKQLKCCGVHTYSDWQTTLWYVHSGSIGVPLSCCNGEDPTCSGDISQPEMLYEQGCLTKLQSRLQLFVVFLFWASIAAIALAVLAAASDGALMGQHPFQDYRILDSAMFT
ncbi:tetraspanin-3-like [Rhinatrema bivittatum]|uniref:tetraspanin-3-like n=1 Tax=Rhinatrema bivittatum TaxID=194408 RepID=UPI00112E8488|nr:tetraspanin-3-like [Rhinatrema bivittatum]